MFFPWLGHWWQLTKAPWLWALFFFQVLMFAMLPHSPSGQEFNSRDYQWLKQQIEETLKGSSPREDWRVQDDLQSWPETQKVYFFLMNDPWWRHLKELEPQSLAKKKEWQWHYQRWSSWRQQWQKEPAYQFGLWGHKAYQLARWITYSLVHASWWHLASNMVFLLMFGAYWIPRLGLGAWLLLYFGGALVGGLSFLLLEPTGLRPMVGASAAVSALIGAFLVNEKRKYVTFYYFISGSQQGLLALPTFFIALYFLVDDIAGLWEVVLSGRLEEVAHAAHLGGWLWGVLFVYGIRWMHSFRQRLAHQVVSEPVDFVRAN
jgi:membrane associated rhomboid family serine protease